MKHFLKNLIYIPFTIIFKFLFKLFFKRKRNNIVIWDIDNTLADTWPSINKQYDSNFDRLAKLHCFPSMKMEFKTYLEDNDHMFLSARGYEYYCTTYKWLKINDFNPTVFNLILVKNAFEKYVLLSKIKKESKTITYFDDLSYNQENGEILFYDETIDRIRQLPITYIDYSEIMNIKKRFYE